MTKSRVYVSDMQAILVEVLEKHAKIEDGVVILGSDQFSSILFELGSALKNHWTKNHIREYTDEHD